MICSKSYHVTRLGLLTGIKADSLATQYSTKGGQGQTQSNGRFLAELRTLVCVPEFQFPSILATHGR